MRDELTPEERSAMRARIVGGAREIKPVGAHRGAWVAGSIAAVLVVAIAGGVAATTTLSAPQIATTPSPVPTPDRTVEPTPTATPTTTPIARQTPERVVTRPESRFEFDCADLAPLLAGLFDGSSPAVASTKLLAHGNLLMDGPMQYAIPQAGGLSCEYGDQDAWASVVIVPDADRLFPDDGSGCPAPSGCTLVDGSYVELQGWPLDGDTATFASARQSIEALVQSSPAAPSQWSPPRGTTALTGRCGDLLPVAEVDAILRREGSRIDEERSGWSVGVAMLDAYWDAHPCDYVSSGSTVYDDPGSSGLRWLPGGEWAFDEGATGESLAAAGGRPSDEARTRCETTEYGESCWVDVAVDGNWVRFDLPGDLVESTRPIIAQKIAEALYERAYR